MSQSGVVALLVLAIILVAGFLVAPISVSAETIPHASAALPEIQQDGSPQGAWDEFWAAFKKWFEELAKVFAEMPLLGPLVSEIFKFIGAAIVWFCGAVIFLMMLLGIYAVRRGL
jgi:hypothetical protein